jgi:hypothetical protein
MGRGAAARKAAAIRHVDAPRAREHLDAAVGEVALLEDLFSKDDERLGAAAAGERERER